MQNFVIDDFFVSNIFYPFLLVCLMMGIISVCLIILHYFVRRIDEIREKEHSINDTFLNLKGLYKKRLVAIDGILTELLKYGEMYNEYEAQVLKNLTDERFKNKKKLEVIHNFGSAPGSIRALLEIDNIINATIQQILSITSRHNDIKSYSKFITLYSDYKNVADHIESTKLLYNRKVREFNSFIIKYPYIIFAIILKVEPRKIF